MDRKRSLLNVTVSIIFKILLMIGNLIVRRNLIKYIGNDINGLNSLYISIIGVLSVADLGIGIAITFGMYKPIVDGDNEKVAALFNLFKKTYIVICSIIVVAGIAIMPLLPKLANGYENLNTNIYLTFALMLISVVITYLFSAKTSLLNAYRDNYIATTISSIGAILQYIMQIIVLVTTRSFVYYLICRIVAAIIQWVATEIITRKKYASIFAIKNVSIDKETSASVQRNIKAMFMHKIGDVLVNTIDSIIISSFINITLLGKYSNYTIIITSMTATISLIFTPLTSIIGHLFVSDKEAFKRYFNFFYGLNCVIGYVFFLGYYAIIDDLILIIFGEGLELSKTISFVVTLNYFIQFMRQSVGIFRDASGTFYNDRWKPLVEGISNLVLSIALVKFFQIIGGESIAIVGVIMATILTNLFICHIVEPYVVYKNALKLSVRKHYLKNYSYIMLFVLLMLILNFVMVSPENKWISLFLNGCISIAISIIPLVIIVLTNKDFRRYCKNTYKKIIGKLKHTENN